MNRSAAFAVLCTFALGTAGSSTSAADDAASPGDAVVSDLGRTDASSMDVPDAGIPALDVMVDDVPDVPPEPPRCPGPFRAPTERELTVRRALGVPDSAGCVLVLAQTSHMDIDWIYRFADYYDRFVGNILTGAQRLLDADPDYRYGVAEMAFLQEHLRQHPEQAASLRSAAGRGALRVVGGGMTSPDTLLPTTEALARDFLRGSIFAETALGVRARAAWLPDSFGHSPTVPDVLASMGYTSVAFARVDGLHDAFEATHHQDEIVAGSTAALLRDMGTADFVWVGPGGGEVLAHWMPRRLYCQGDNLDNSGSPVPGGYVNDHPRGDDAAYTNGRIAGYVREMTPYARTPYVFIPIGCDFQSPKTDLLAIVRRWNATQAASTGIWVVASTFEDYASLLDTRRDDLPHMTRDLAPYMTGYLGSRLALKYAVRRAGDALAQAESASLLATAMGGVPYPAQALADAWDLFARSDHHDFIAGTALDTVTTGEQLPWMNTVADDARAITATAVLSVARNVGPEPASTASAVVLGGLGARGPRAATVALTFGAGVHDVGSTAPTQVLASTRNADGTLASATVLVVAPDVPPLGYQRVAFADRAASGPVSVVEAADTITLRDTSAALVAVIDRSTGMLRSLAVDGRETLAAPSLDLRVWDDQGGLYRIGSETLGCNFAPSDPIEGTPTITVLDRGPVRASVRVQRGTTTVTMSVTAAMRALAGRLDVDVDAAALRGQTYTLHVATNASGATGWFDEPAGVVQRPSHALFDPTFWPTVRGMDLLRGDGTGFAVLTSVSTGVRWGDDGSVDVMVSRNAYTERCDVLGASGTEAVHHALRFSLRPHAGAFDLLADAYATLEAAAAQATGTTGGAASASVLGLAGTGFVVSAGKRAERGEGTIVRVQRTAPTAPLTITAGLLPVGSITRVDLLERDDAPVSNPLVLDAPVVTLRVRGP